MTSTATALYRVPFNTAPPKVFTFDPKMTLEQMAGSFPGLPSDFTQHGTIMIGGHVIKRKFWHRTRLRPGKEATFHYALGFGGGGGRSRTKSIIGIIIGIASILTAGLAANGFFAFGNAASIFAKGALGAKLLAGGIAIAGQIAMRMLTPAPSFPDQDGDKPSPTAASASQNVLGMGTPIPRVIGSRRCFPAGAMPPLITRNGVDEYVETIFCLAGPHKLSDIQIGGAPIEAAEGIEYETREGWPSDAPLSLIQRYGVTRGDVIEMPPNATDDDSTYQDILRDQVRPENSIVKFHSTSTVANADEIRLDLAAPQGLYDSDQSAHPRVLLGLRIRVKVNGEYKNFPQLLYSSRGQRDRRITVILRRGDRPTDTLPKMASGDGFVAAYKYVQGQGSPVPSPDWTSDASFSSGAGGDILRLGTVATSKVKNISCDGSEATVWLNSTTFPSDVAYEIEIKRSAVWYADVFDYDNYLYAGERRDFFYYMKDSVTGTWLSTHGRRGISDAVYLQRCTSIFYKHPIYNGNIGSGLALIAIKAKNRSLDNVSVMASGYVRDWDGAGWNEWKVSSNPAPHFIDILTGWLSPDPLDTDLIDNTSIVDWRQDCIDKARTCNFIAEGSRMQDVLNIVAGCGFARPRQSEVWGVIRDYDRSNEDPVQIFTSDNAWSVEMTKAFTRMPDAFRAVWYDATKLDTPNEVIVYRDGINQAMPNPRLEEMRYEGLSLEADVRQRALFDLRQVQYRAHEFAFNAPAEAITCTRGDLIGLNHDSIDVFNDALRVESCEVVNGYIQSIYLSGHVAMENNPEFFSIPDVLAEPNILDAGQQTAIVVRRSTGIITTHKVSVDGGDGARVILATPIPVEFDPDDGRAQIRGDCLVAIGRFGSEYLRLVITALEYDKDMTARITAVPEAPQLWQ